MVTTICQQRKPIVSQNKRLHDSPGFGLRIFRSFGGMLIWSESCLAFCLFLDKASSPMERGNQTGAGHFLLLGFTEKPFFFGLFLSMYLVTFTGNLLLLLAVSSDSHLHTPMYFFLANLSFVDICFTSTTVPKMLWNIQTQRKLITCAGCLSQIFFFIVFGCLDNLLLTVMAYDRFVAICHPLHYMVIMNPQLCRLLAVGSWCISVVGSLLETLTLLRLSFCTNMEIPHFFCDLPEVLKLACSDTFVNTMVVYFVTIVLGVFPLSGILFSYSQIFSSILKISSARGKYKAFSTCGSHLSVVSLFYGTGLGVYLSSAATSSSRTSLVASVMYTIVTPMLNPFIYSLRNRDMKVALGRLLSRAVPLSVGEPLQDSHE
ncbi:olfactory receptor 7C2-like [Panthera onca]|uniref:olfactory receptor 7C2-like n=1 Tax=Panthera onca TaxID=9690 RepID=UPI002955CE32|nr:olfactory receptor 7C2-like [Panthera onca]